jgi:hypothetical protein
LPSEQCKEPEFSNSFAQSQKKPTILEPACHCENLQQSLDLQINNCLQSAEDTTNIKRKDSSPVLLMNQGHTGEEKLRSRTSSDIQPTPIEASELVGYLN